MRLYPAIDIKNGQCVRLRQGVFEDTTVYANQPFEVAKEFEAEGAKFLHIVDLDGALRGTGANDEALKKIDKKCGSSVLETLKQNSQDLYNKIKGND